MEHSNALLAQCNKNSCDKYCEKLEDEQIKNSKTQKIKGPSKSTHLILPCVVGSIIYWLNGRVCGGIVSHIVVDITSRGTTGIIFVQCDDYVEEFKLEDFNKEWFLSEEDCIKKETLEEAIEI